MVFNILYFLVCVVGIDEPAGCCYVGICIDVEIWLLTFGIDYPTQNESKACNNDTSSNECIGHP